MKDNGLLLSKYIALGSKVELEVIDRVLQDDGSYLKKKYESKVVEIISDDRLVVNMPVEQGNTVLLPVGSEYDIHIFTPEGLFQCIVRVVNRYKEGEKSLLEIEIISNLVKYQRREYYRYSCMLPIKFRLLAQDEIADFKDKKEIKFMELPMSDAEIVNISGGGMRFLTKDICEPNDLIITNYSIIDGKEFSHIAKVLAVKPLDNPLADGDFEIRCQFVNIQNDERVMIIKYIFEEERKKRKLES